MKSGKASKRYVLSLFGVTENEFILFFTILQNMKFLQQVLES